MAQSSPTTKGLLSGAKAGVPVASTSPRFVSQVHSQESIPSHDESLGLGIKRFKKDESIEADSIQTFKFGKAFRANQATKQPRADSHNVHTTDGPTRHPHTNSDVRAVGEFCPPNFEHFKNTTEGQFMPLAKSLFNKPQKHTASSGDKPQDRPPQQPQSFFHKPTLPQPHQSSTRNEPKPSLSTQDRDAIASRLNRPEHDEPMAATDKHHRAISRHVTPVVGDLEVPSRDTPSGTPCQSPIRNDGPVMANRASRTDPVPSPASSAFRPMSSTSNMSKKRAQLGRLSLQNPDEMMDLERFGSAWNTYLVNQKSRQEKHERWITKLSQESSEQRKKADKYRHQRDRYYAAVSNLETRLSELETKNTQLSDQNSQLVDQFNEQVESHKTAVSELESKSSELESKSSELESKSSELESKSSELESKSSELESKSSELSRQNTQLEHQVEQLQEQLSAHDSRNADLQAKIKYYRDKVNEAITEQQELYKRSKTVCDDTINQMRREEAEARAEFQSDLEKLETGMQQAEKVRAGLKECFEDQMREDRQRIVDLKRELTQEQEKSAHLAQQLHEVERDIDVSHKLDEILRQMQASASDTSEVSRLTSSIDAMVTTLDSTKTAVIDDIKSVVTGQAALQTASSTLETTVTDQLTTVRNELKEQEGRLKVDIAQKEEECRELAVQLNEKDNELKRAAGCIEQESRLAAGKCQQVEELDRKVKELEAVCRDKLSLESKNEALKEKLAEEASSSERLQKQLDLARSRSEGDIRDAESRLGTKEGELGELAAAGDRLRSELDAEKRRLEEARKVIQEHKKAKTKLETERSILAKSLDALKSMRGDKGAVLDKIQRDLVESEQRMENLRHRLKKSDTKTQRIRSTLKQWAQLEPSSTIPESTEGLDEAGLRSLVQRLIDGRKLTATAKDCLFDLLGVGDSQLSWVSDSSMVPVDIDPPSTPDPAELHDLLDSEASSPLSEPPDAIEMDDIRRVVLRSPGDGCEGEITVAPSVEEEQEIRRAASTPLPILKRSAALNSQEELVTDAATTNDEQPRDQNTQRSSQEANSAGPITRSRAKSKAPSRAQYSQPVSGRPTLRSQPKSVNLSDEQHEALLVDIRKGFRSQQLQGLDTGTTPEAPRKRKDRSTSEDSSAKKARSNKPKTSIFSQLEFETGSTDGVGDLAVTSSYFRGPPQPHIASPQTASLQPSSSMSTASQSALVLKERKGQSKGVKRTYSERQRAPVAVDDPK